jgi:hypothetical protein
MTLLFVGLSVTRISCLEDVTKMSYDYTPIYMGTPFLFTHINAFTCFSAIMVFLELSAYQIGINFASSMES